MRLRFLLFLLLLCSSVSAQQKKNRLGILGRYIDYLVNDTADVSKPKLLIYPTVGFAPETSWEFGFSTLYVYQANRDSINRLSELSAFTFYTLENQYGVWLDHALYTDKNEWFFLGRFRFQSFPLLYYGTGSEAPSDPLAEIEGNFFLLKERVLREIKPSLYAGLELDFSQLYRVSYEDLEDGFSQPLGGNGSRNFGLGLGIVYDNIHNALNARDGLFSELAFLKYDQAWGSDFSFTTVVSDNRVYRPVNKRDVFAAQLFGQFTVAGQPPFNQMALLGGENLMRGYYLGRYRDNNLIAGQVEYRFLPFSFSKRWGATLFLASGQVFDQFNNLTLNRFLPTAGSGLRFLLFPKKDIFTRIDVAFTREGPGFYFFIGEAF